MPEEKSSVEKIEKFVEEKEFEQTLSAGEILFKEGDPGEKMYLIKSGRIRISRKGGDFDKTLAILKEGDFFGEMAVIDGSPRSATATAIDEVKLLIWDRDAFRAQVKENPIIEYVLSTMTKRLRDANLQIQLLLIKDDTRRVASYLIHEAKAKGPSLYTDFTVEDFANRVGISEAKVKEILERLSSLGLIKLEEGSLSIPNLGDLEEYLHYISLREKFGT